MKKGLIFVVGLDILVCAITLFAHHNAGVSYDLKQKITLTGTVTQYLLINPHALIHFDVKDESGKVTGWVAESEAPQRLYRSGWRKDTLKPGDTITIIGNPARNGKKWIALLKAMTPDGKSVDFDDGASERY